MSNQRDVLEPQLRELTVEELESVSGGGLLSGLLGNIPVVGPVVSGLVNGPATIVGGLLGGIPGLGPIIKFLL